MCDSECPSDIYFLIMFVIIAVAPILNGTLLSKIVESTIHHSLNTILVISILSSLGGGIPPGFPDVLPLESRLSGNFCS